jgi:hypothetical protein
MFNLIDQSASDEFESISYVGYHQACLFVEPLVYILLCHLYVSVIYSISCSTLNKLVGVMIPGCLKASIS